MKALHIYEVRMIDGSRYRGEIAYRDDMKIVLKQCDGISDDHIPEQLPKISLFYNGIISIRELGWQRQLLR